MENLYIKETEFTPEIDFNAQTGNLLLKGRAISEYMAKFYQPILDWLHEYKKVAQKTTIFHAKYEYFSSDSSDKTTLDILSALEEIEGVMVYWYYLEDDEDMQEAGEEFAELLEVPFKFIVC